jgi:hypothetical protein
MTTLPTTTVDISALDGTGAGRPVHHAAARSTQDAWSIIASHAPAPVNRAVRARIERASGGVIRIGQITAAVQILP